jgi:aldose 1-epimerase
VDSSLPDEIACARLTQDHRLMARNPALPIAPSGEQLEIGVGDQRAVVVELGGGLRSHTVDGVDVVDGYGADEMCTSGRGQVLMPWPNRIEEGSYKFDGRRHQLALTEPENGNAIHGLVRWARWSVAERDAHRVVVEHVLHPQPGYPFTIALRIEYALSDDGLAVRTTATNVGTGVCPFGSGAHPYLTFGTETIDAVVLQLPARMVLRTDARGLPVDELPVEGTDYDFREARAIGATKLDNAFTTLSHDDDGVARVVLRDPESNASITLWVDDAYPYLMIFTGDTLPDVNRRSVAVEPMTCPPNAFRTGTDVITLEAGASWTGAWGIDVTGRP